MPSFLSKFVIINLLLCVSQISFSQQNPKADLKWEALYAGRWIEMKRTAKLSLSNLPSEIRLHVVSEKADKSKYVIKYLLVYGEGSIPALQKEANTHNLSEKGTSIELEVSESMPFVKVGNHIVFDVKKVYRLDENNKARETKIKARVFWVEFVK